ncbi:unnamed protein product [Mytilus edulis]|uniref:G-protein coupled receptors family 1 profile domain-containing protein n=1 Tax=Mytilus edulis TaxID=6550 RepID=A0A8S3QZH3_MYTED|nr:unnamed protein product [Mytilus edulis]
MVICSPFGVNYGINKYEKNGNIVGKRWDLLKNPDFYISGLSFAIAFAVYVFFVVLSLFILYGMVGWKILNHIRVKKPTLSFSSADKMEQLVNEDTCNTIMGETPSDNQMISDVKDGKRKHKDSSRITVEDKNHKEKEMMVPSDFTKSMLSIKEKHCVLECKGYEASADTVCPPLNPFVTARPIPYSQPIRHNSNERKVVESPEDCRLPSYHSNEDNHLSKTPVAYYEQSNQRTKRVKQNFSLMFIAITLVAIICYCPIGAVVLLEGIFPDFWENFTSTESHVILWFYRTFIINSIINPFLYACLDTEFYNACKRLFRK